MFQKVYKCSKRFGNVSGMLYTIYKYKVLERSINGVIGFNFSFERNEPNECLF
jgi:hypothetical protein